MIGILVVLKCRVAFNRNILHEGQYRTWVLDYICSSLQLVEAYQA